MKLVRKLAAKLNGDAIVRMIVGRGASAILLKSAAAVLSFVMFIILARAMDSADYGRFGFAFSFATFVGIVCDLGLQKLMLRQLPIYESDNDDPRKNGITKAAYAAVAMTSVLGMLFVVVFAGFQDAETSSALLAGILLVPAFAFAQAQSGILRGHGSIWRALGAKELAWRFLIILIVGYVVWQHGGSLSAETTLYIVSGLLIAILVIQAFSHPGAAAQLLDRSPRTFEIAQWRKSSMGLWGTSIVQLGAPNLAIVIVGLAISAEEIGGFFAAIRIAALLSFFLIAFNLVTGPMLARAWHEQKIEQLQRICKLAIAGAAVPCVALFAVVVVWGETLLGLFDPAFRSIYLVLLILCAGEIVNVLCGQAAMMMTMTGHERQLLKIQVVVYSVCFVGLYIGSLIFGLVAAAVMIALAKSGWNIWSVRAVKSYTGIDPSVMSWLKPHVHSA